MRTKELSYRLELDLTSSPEQLWPLVADTDRFNRDAGIPPVSRVTVGANARRRLRLSRLGVPIEWEEEPFEWVQPHRFSVLRRYVSGPLESMWTSARLEERPDRRTHLVYEIRVRPRNLAGRIAAQLEIGFLRRRRFAAVLGAYDREVAAGNKSTRQRQRPELAAGGLARIAEARAALVAAGAEPRVVQRLCDIVARGDDRSVERLRPYVLAEAWGTGRRETLAVCLEATRSGLLELRWELLCPLCRGAAATAESLDVVGQTYHCETCRIDFAAEFDRSVEITFRPTPSVRAVEAREFCVGGPQLTPHVVVQQLVAASSGRAVQLQLEPGRYRLRTLGRDEGFAIGVEDGGSEHATVRIGVSGGDSNDLSVGTKTTLELVNGTDVEQLIVLERTEWAENAATAAEVTTLQVYRDLFAAESLRAQAPISVGTLTVVFTDLRGSTRFYRQIGDAPAFGSVLDHIDLLRRVVAAEDGAVVKQMGDAIMAVFARPLSAVRAMSAAQRELQGRPLPLKVGIHTGPCIAVNQNGVLDYFGSTVNLAARLVAMSAGGDLVVSDAVLADPEIKELQLQAERLDGVPKGFEDDVVSLWSVRS
jgi:class 3 adenylate cyclase